MAKIVLGVASSHSPQLSTASELWTLHADRDRASKQLWFRGTVYDYPQLLEARSSDRIDEHVDEEQWLAKHQRCDQAIAKLRAALDEVRPDVLVILGDDQRELFLDDGMPTFAVYWGQHIESNPGPLEDLSPASRAAAWANRGEHLEHFPCVPELGEHIVREMMSEGFDVAQMKRQPEGRSVGHAFTFVRTRLMNENPIPMVPVMINTYFPPNQPTVSRCYSFGKALASAIETWKGQTGSMRVAVIASGGLSHIVIDEELDTRVLDGLSANRQQRLLDLDERELVGGTSEIRNWIALTGAMRKLQPDVLDYVPAYRTPAGTGCGMAFALWRTSD